MERGNVKHWKFLGDLILSQVSNCQRCGRCNAGLSLVRHSFPIVLFKVVCVGNTHFHTQRGGLGGKAEWWRLLDPGLMGIFILHLLLFFSFLVEYVLFL